MTLTAKTFSQVIKAVKTLGEEEIKSILKTAAKNTKDLLIDEVSAVLTLKKSYIKRKLSVTSSPQDRKIAIKVFATRLASYKTKQLKVKSKTVPGKKNDGVSIQVYKAKSPKVSRKMFFLNLKNANIPSLFARDGKARYPITHQKNFHIFSEVQRFLRKNPYFLVSLIRKEIKRNGN